MPTIQKITPCFIFNGTAEKAIDFYVSIFNNSKILEVTRCSDAGPGPNGSLLVATFQLDGQEFIALNYGPPCTFNEAISFSISCETQEEVDHYWNALTANGGKPIQCGWLVDKFGVSWQVVPTNLPKRLNDPDPAKVACVMQAMMSMVKLDIAKIEEAYSG